jgi:hypothetical protein
MMQNELGPCSQFFLLVVASHVVAEEGDEELGLSTKEMESSFREIRHVS